ncbi:MAG: hypothetical protein ACLTDP_11810 [Terrisporobacter sp.]
MNHCSTEYIETNRLILRQFKVEDAKICTIIGHQNDEVTKFLTWPTYANVLESKEVIGSIRVPIIGIISNIAPPV